MVAVHWCSLDCMKFVVVTAAALHRTYPLQAKQEDMMAS